MTKGMDSVSKFLLNYLNPKGTHNRKDIAQRLTLTNKEIEKFESGMNGKKRDRIIFCILGLPVPCDDCTYVIQSRNVQIALLKNDVRSFHMSCFDKGLDEIVPYNKELKKHLKSLISEFQDYNLRQAV